MKVYAELNQEYTGIGTFVGYTYAATREGVNLFQGVLYETPIQAVEQGLEPMLLAYPTIKGDSTSHTRVVKVYEVSF